MLPEKRTAAADALDRQAGSIERRHTNIEVGQIDGKTKSHDECDEHHSDDAIHAQTARHGEHRGTIDSLRNNRRIKGVHSTFCAGAPMTVDF